MFKDLDRTSIIIIILCIALIFSWSYIFGPKGLNIMSQPSQASEKIAKTEDQIVKTPSAVETVNSTQNAAVSSPVLPTETTTQSKSNYKNVILTNPKSLIEVEINPNNGAVDSVLLKDSLDVNQKNKIVLDKGVVPGALSFTGGQNEWTLKKTYEPVIKDNNNELIIKRKFEDQSGNSFLIEQDWKLEINYTIDYSVTVYNLEKKNIKFPEFYVWAGGVPPIEYLTGDIARSEAHRIDTLATENNEVSSIKVEEKNFPNNQEIASSVKWMAISNKYFTNILKPLSNDGNFYGGIYTVRKKRTGHYQRRKKGILSGICRRNN